MCLTYFDKLYFDKGLRTAATPQAAPPSLIHVNP